MFRCRDSNSDKIIIGLVVSYTQREPKLLLRLSENGGYLSRSAISCIDYRFATLGTRSPPALPTNCKFARAPIIRRVGSITIYTKSPSSY